MFTETGSPSEVVALLVELLDHDPLDLPMLHRLTTPEAATRWGDFRFLAYNWSILDRPGIMMQEQSEPDSLDVVVVPIIQGVDESFTVAPGQLLPVIGVFTLVLSRSQGRWLVHHFTEDSRRPAPEDVPRD